MDGRTVGRVECRWSEFDRREHWVGFVAAVGGEVLVRGVHGVARDFSSPERAADAVAAEHGRRVLRTTVLAVLGQPEARFVALLYAARQHGAGLAELLTVLQAMQTAGEITSTDGTRFHWQLTPKASA